MTKNANYVSHKKSKLKNQDGSPKLPVASALVEGEIAINFAENVETLSIINESGDVVTFSSDNYYTEKKLGSGFTGANSAVTVTEALENAEIDVDQDFSNTASTNPISTKAVYSAVTDNELVWTNAYVTLSGVVSSHTVNTNIHLADGDREKIDSIDTLSGTVTVHTANTEIHVTATDKTSWDNAATNSHTHNNKAALDSITGNVGAMAYEDKASYSSATEVNTALGNKANTSDLADFFDDAKYEDSGATKVINFYHGNTIKATIDASDFIVDGMVEDVRIENGNLVIDFNTASGKQDISIPLTDIFDPSNYYNKAAIDNLVGSGFTSSSITDVIIENEEIVSAALTDLDERKLDASAYTPTDLSNYYTKSEVDARYLWVSGTGENAIVQKGGNNTASGNYSIAEGKSTSATSFTSHAEGSTSLASGGSSHAEGEGTSATSYGSHSEGGRTIAVGSYAHAEGESTIASGDCSHAEGKMTSATTIYAHAEGTNTIASGQSSHAEGIRTSATTNYSHAEGAYTLASGSSSHAEGYETKAFGEYSHAEGANTIANNTAEHASGRYNVSSSASTDFGDSGNTLFSVGNGTYNARHNAFEIRQNGDIYITSGNSDIKLQDYIGSVETVTAITPSNSGSTAPIATKVVAENELTVSNALNDLNSNKADKAADLDNVKIKKITQSAYDALVQAGTVDSNTLYFIYD